MYSLPEVEFYFWANPISNQGGTLESELFFTARLYQLNWIV
jgi:hypothetical protein